MHDLISVPEAAKRAGVSRDTMRRAAKNGTIKAERLGRDWFVHSEDITRWQNENYRPNMAKRYPPKNQDDSSS